MYHYKRYIAIFVAGVCLAMAPVFAWAADNKEALVKAAFIYNFVKFVDWPDGKAIGQQSRIDICVLGSSDVGGAGSVFKAASSAKLSLSLVRESNWKNAANHCHVLFISQSEEGKLGDIIGGLAGAPVLTVSDIDGFADNGGMIGFVNSDGKIKLEINKKSATGSSLRVNAQLLEIALKVIDR